jgi:hypothetical protein
MNGLSYKHKCMLLIAAFALFIYIGYVFSFSDTFELANGLSEKKEKLRWLKEKEKELPVLKAKLKEFDKAYSKNDSISVRDKLTAYISDYAENNNCLVTEIPTNTSYRSDNLKIQTNTFTVKGSYKNLVPLIYHLENDCKYLAKLISVKFYTTRDLQKKRKELFVTIVAQSFEQKTKDA